MKILGKRTDGVVLVDIGANIAFAVDLKRRLVANLGDVMSPAAQSAEWHPVARSEASELRFPVQQMVDGKGTVVPAAIMLRDRDEDEAHRRAWETRHGQGEGDEGGTSRRDRDPDSDYGKASAASADERNIGKPLGGMMRVSRQQPDGSIRSVADKDFKSESAAREAHAATHEALKTAGFEADGDEKHSKDDALYRGHESTVTAKFSHPDGREAVSEFTTMTTPRGQTIDETKYRVRVTVTRPKGYAAIDDDPPKRSRGGGILGNYY